MKDLLLLVVRKVAEFLAAFLVGKLHEQKKQVEDDLKKTVEEAERLARAPDSDADFHERLRERIAAKHEANDQRGYGRMRRR